MIRQSKAPCFEKDILTSLTFRSSRTNRMKCILNEGRNALLLKNRVYLDTMTAKLERSRPCLDES